jgi:hypothetical protein
MSGGPDYSQFKESIEIPFSNAGGEGSTPAIDILVNGKEVSKATTSDKLAVGLDTGSVIFAISDDLVDGFPEDPEEAKLEPGKVGYGTSPTKYEGFWYSIEVTFDDKKGKKAIAKVKALVVSWETYGAVHYMGIGFRPLNVDNGTIPQNNTLLGIYKTTTSPINETFLDDSNFCHGYIMRDRSIIIGLTESNTESFHFTKLSAGSHADHKWYWDEVPVSLRLNDEAWYRGKALIDTGLPDMALNTTGDSTASTRLGTLHHVAIKFPDENSTIEYSFQWPAKDGKLEPWLPKTITTYVSSHEGEIWLNTGQNFYKKFDTLFDADRGYWGLREAKK